MNQLPNWNVLRIAETGRTLRCESCGLPMKAGFRLPEIRLCCSIQCLECATFGFDRCRWCGKKLDGHRRHCSIECHEKETDARHGGCVMGDGQRLLAYLAANFPELHAKVTCNGQGCEDAGAICPA